MLCRFTPPYYTYWQKQRSYCHAGDLVMIICRCPGFSILGRWGRVPPSLTRQKVAHSPHLENSSSVDSRHQRFPLQWSKSFLHRLLPPNKNGGKSLHPSTLFGKSWCYCVGMSWYTAPFISRCVPLYLLHKVLLPALTLSLLEKLKNSIYEMPIIQQTSNINNSRITRPKSINLHTIRKLI